MISHDPMVFHPLPTVEFCVDSSDRVLYWRRGLVIAGYSYGALTDCGHNCIHLSVMKSNGYDLTPCPEHYGITVRCSQCGQVQSFGVAKPGARRYA